VYALVSNLEFYLLLLGWVLMGWVLWDWSRDHLKDRKRRAHARVRRSLHRTGPSQNYRRHQEHRHARRW
jgi:hypothetical protein